MGLAIYTTRTVIYTAEDTRPAWDGWKTEVCVDEDGDVMVFAIGPRDGIYPSFDPPRVKREDIPALIEALAKTLV